jgi:hypothetical protein
MSRLSRFVKKNRGWIAPVAGVATGGLGYGAMAGGAGGGLGAAGQGVGAGGAGGLGGVTGGLPSRGAGGLGADFSGADMRQQQDYNIGALLNAYNGILGGLGGIQGPETAAYSQLAGQYGQNLQAGLAQSGLADLYGPAYEQALQGLALRQGDVGGLAAARLATQSTAGRGGGFGGAGANQVRQAQGEASMGTQQALLAGRAGAEQGRAGVSSQMAQLLAGGAQQQLQAQLAGLQAQQQLALGRLGTFGGLGSSLLGGIAKVSPEDTNKEFENSLRIWQMLNSSVSSATGGGGIPGLGGGGGGLR